MLKAPAYRAKAREMREYAASAHDPVIHKELLRLAEQYEALARQTEMLLPKDDQLRRSDPSD
jgi:hypothetical protein